MSNETGEQKKTTQGNLVLNKHTIWTVPNILVFLRIICAPIYMTLLILGSRANETNGYQYWWIYVSLGVLFFAALTDFFDGKIARRFKAGTKFGKYVVKHNQGSYLGQAIDPVADIVMFISVFLALVLSRSPSGYAYLHWAFFACLCVSESFIFITGAVLVDKVNVKANMPGKIACWVMAAGAIMCYFHPFFETLWTGFTLEWIVIAIGLSLNWTSAVWFGVDVFTQLKRNKEIMKENQTTQTENEVGENNEENKTEKE